jgi:hypothetical protein
MILTDLSFEEIEDYRDKISDIAYDIELDTGIILSPIIKNIDKYNSRANFVPFYEPSLEKTEQQIETSKELVRLVEDYISNYYKKN